MKKVQGFTLVEVMIVVAVIGILAVIAMPVFSSMVLRSKVTASVADISALKVNFQNLMMDGVDINSVTDLGGAQSTVNCSSISATGQAGKGIGQIVCVIGSADSSIMGKKVTLSYGIDQQWSCLTTAPAAFSPSSCPGN